MEKIKKSDLNWKKAILLQPKNQSVFHCKTVDCNKSFRNYNSYTRHCQNHDGVEHKCDVCGKLFLAKHYLKQHIQKSKKCIQLRKAIANGDIQKSEKEKEKKIKKREGQIKKKCFKCNEEFNYYRMRQHLPVCLSKEELDTVMEEVKPVSCATCSRKFVTVIHLTRHKCTLNVKSEEENTPRTMDTEEEKINLDFPTIVPDNREKKVDLLQSILEESDIVAMEEGDDVKEEKNVENVVDGQEEVHVSELIDDFLNSSMEEEEFKVVNVKEHFRVEEQDEDDPLKELRRDCQMYEESLKKSFHFL